MHSESLAGNSACIFAKQRKEAYKFCLVSLFGVIISFICRQTLPAFIGNYLLIVIFCVIVPLLELTLMKYIPFSNEAVFKEIVFSPLDKDLEPRFITVLPIRSVTFTSAFVF